MTTFYRIGGENFFGVGSRVIWVAGLSWACQMSARPPNALQGDALWTSPIHDIKGYKLSRLI